MPQRPEFFSGSDRLTDFYLFHGHGTTSALLKVTENLLLLLDIFFTTSNFFVQEPIVEEQELAKKDHELEKMKDWMFFKKYFA